MKEYQKLPFVETQIQNGYTNQDGVVVPRVTHILSAMLHEDYLIPCANAMGLYKHLKYEDIMNNATYIGSATHYYIECFLKGEPTPQRDKDEVYKATQSFHEWWDIIKKTDYEILMQERTLVCKYFGGTLDLLIKINGKVYLVDFKTSNHSSYKHFLQLSAYKYMLEEEGVNIDGCIVLMLDKKNFKFTEHVLHFDNKEHLDFINICKDCFISLVYAYYHRIVVEREYKALF